MKVIKQMWANLVQVLRFIKNILWVPQNGGEKLYPKVIQLPITYKCNSKCVMCDIWRMDNSGESSVKEFKKFMSDNIFKEVQAVGINGGEPTMVANLPEYASAILELPKIKSLNLISNGFRPHLLLKSLEDIYRACILKKVNFHVSVSLDGVNSVHDKTRGVPGVFKKVIESIDELSANQQRYCDSFDIGCTVTKQNVFHLMELDSYAQLKNYSIKYRLGVWNKRIGSDSILDQFSVLEDPYRQSAAEFFHYLMVRSKSLNDKFKYFSIFRWLTSKKRKRFLGCVWKNEGITLDSRGNLYYCAVASNAIGCLRNSDGEKIFFDDKNIEYRKSIINEYCNKCIHDYSGKIEFSCAAYFLKYLFLNKIAMQIHKIKARLLR